MKNCVIIAEYNPFHNGHMWQIEQARKLGAKTITVIMSGNFVQRGSMSIFPKECRTTVALNCGADLVIELPAPYSTATAEKFACSGVDIANHLGFIDSIIFGAETPDISKLMEIAEMLLTPQFSDVLKTYLSDGITFAVARSHACETILTGSSDILSSPNNILSIEYCKAILKTKSKITPFVLGRIGAHHHATATDGKYASATYLRGIPQENWGDFVPEKALEIYNKEHGNENMLDYNRFELASVSRLRFASTSYIAEIADVSEGLENTLYNAIQKATTLEDVYSMAKSKRYTHARIRRLVLSTVLGLKKSLPYSPPYIRVLGANSDGFTLLGENKKNITLPYSHSISILKQQNTDCYKIATAQVQCEDFYSLCLKRPLPAGSEYRYKIINKKER